MAAGDLPVGFTLDQPAGLPAGFKLDSPAPASTASKVADAAIQYNPGIGLGETALALGSGIAGQVAGGFSGLGTMATNALGLTDTPPGDRVRQVADAMTYEPRTALARRITAGVAAPAELLAEGADKAGGAVTDVTGSPAAGAAVNTLINAAPMALGPAAKLLPGESAASIAARARTKALNAKTDAGIAAAREAGLAITPTMAENGVVAKTTESLSGSPRLEKGMSKKNAPVINDLIRNDVGLADDVPLSREALAKVREEEGKHYEFIKNTGRVETDARYQADLHKIEASYETAAKDFKHRAEKPFQKTIDGLHTDGFDATSAVEEVKLLRSDADKAYRTGDNQLGKAYKDMARAVDDQLDRHLKKQAMTSDLSGDPAFANAVARYQEARTRIAKSYAADKALNDSTGNINAAVYARESKNKPGMLTGGAKQVADFATQFPKAAQRVETVGSTGPTFADYAMGTLAGVGGAVTHGAVGGGAALPLVLARPAARAAMLSDIGQEGITAPRTYGPSKIRRLQDLISQITAEQAAAATATGQRR